MIPLRSSERTYSPAVVTLTLIAINMIVFLYELTMPSSYLNNFIRLHGIVPYRFHYSSLLTSMFLHGGWLHVLGNMWFLWIFGKAIEDLLGHFRFLIFYLLCGLAAGLIHVYTNYDSSVPTIGASGAIAGVMGAYLIKFPHSRIVTLVFIFFFITTVEVPAVLMLLYWFFIQFFSGIGTIGYSHVSQGGTAFFAHIGGFIAGMILISLMGTKPKYMQRRDLNW